MSQLNPLGDENVSADLLAGESPSTDAEEAGLRTLEDILRQPRPAASYSDDPECQRIVQLVEKIGTPAAPSAKDEKGDNQLPHERLGQYELLDKLGEGGMGAVYKALHTKLNKLVALKVLPTNRLADTQAVARFEREMRAVGQLNHTNIVAAHDAGEVDGNHYLVMELVDGLDLSTLVRSCGPLPLAEACEVIRRAAEGLQHAYESGMVHRDIKPGNLMLTFDGQVKILDMGLALLDEMNGPGKVELTTTGAMMGTLDYMAPEQGMDSHQVDIRADIYSLGATLFKLLTGETPFHGLAYDNQVKKILALATETPRTLAEVRDDVPPELSSLVARMLAKQPDDRPATPQDVIDLLAPFAAGAQLAEVARVAKDHVESEADAPSSDTFAHLRSSFTDTCPTIEKVPLPLVQQAAPPRKTRRWWIAAASLAGILVLAIILTLRTDKGTIIVEVPEGEEENVEISVRQGGNEVEVLDADNGWSIRVEEGKYQLDVKKGGDRFALENNTLTVTRDGNARVKLTLKPTQVASSDQEPVSERAVLAELPSTTKSRSVPLPSDAKEFGGHWYKVFNKSKMRWEKAATFCEQQGGHLARIESQEEYDFVRSLGLTQDYWIDGSEGPKADEWVYGDGSPMTFLPWMEGAPTASSEEEHLELDAETKHRFKDSRGTIDKYFICEWSPNHALAFDGDRDYVLTPLKYDGSHPITLEAWVTLDNASKGCLIANQLGGGMRVLMGKYYCRYYVVAAGDRKESAIRLADSSDKPGVIFPLQQRIHIAAVVDESEIRLYIDGRQHAPAQPLDQHKPTGAPFLIGADPQSSTLSNLGDFFHGQIDEIRVSKVARYDNPFTPAERFDADGDTLALYHCDEGQGNILIDSSPNKLHGKIVGATWVDPANAFPATGTVEEKKAWLIAELKRLNPGFEGKAGFELKEEKIVGVNLNDSGVADLSPLRSLAHLERVFVRGCPVSDLSPLAGRKISDIEANETRVHDLMPLKGMPIIRLQLLSSHVSDLSALKGMPLEYLTCENTSVEDLTPLAGAPLKILMVQSTRVSDLSPLKNMPLEHLHCDFDANRDATILRQITTLKTINGKPAAEILSGDNSAIVPATPFPAAGTVDGKKAWLIAELKRLNPTFHGNMRFHVELGQIQHVAIDTPSISDISPLQKLNDLTLVDLRNTNTKDLSPLTTLPLESLVVWGCLAIRDVTALRGMPLENVSLHKQPITDLSPLADLRKLRVASFTDCTKLADLSPLVNLPVEDLTINSTSVDDLSILRNMRLRRLVCFFTKVSDLSPLTGMSTLTYLHCGSTRVSDLRPLSGLKLEHLWVNELQISDLSPLQGMPLVELRCYATPVADLSPLAGMPLTILDISKTKVSDLSPLVDCPLEELRCDFDSNRDAAVLRQIKTLKTINGRPVAEVLGEETPQENTRGEETTAAPPENNSAVRLWKDRTGAYSVQAVLVAVDGEKASLKRAEDHQVVEVSISQLSDEDQQFIRAWQTNETTGEKK